MDDDEKEAEDGASDGRQREAAALSVQSSWAKRATTAGDFMVAAAWG